MKRHFKDVGVFNVESDQPENGAKLKFISNGNIMYLYFDRLRLWQLARQIQDIFTKDLSRAQARRDIFK